MCLTSPRPAPPVMGVLAALFPPPSRHHHPCGPLMHCELRSSSPPLARPAEDAKGRGNRAMFEKRWPAAVEAFTEALHYAPGAPQLYCLRAGGRAGRDGGGAVGGRAVAWDWQVPGVGEQ